VTDWRKHQPPAADDAPVPTTDRRFTMCGRFHRILPVADVAAFFDLGGMPELGPRYNVAPTQTVLAVRQGEGGREGVLFRWGVTPRGATGRCS
jgi:putative SOS response-associated peptidase YedK